MQWTFCITMEWIIKLEYKLFNLKYPILAFRGQDVFIQKNEQRAFDFTTKQLFKSIKANSFVRFFGESTA